MGKVYMVSSLYSTMKSFHLTLLLFFKESKTETHEKFGLKSVCLH